MITMNNCEHVLCSEEADKTQSRKFKSPNYMIPPPPTSRPEEEKKTYNVTKYF